MYLEAVLDRETFFNAVEERCVGHGTIDLMTMKEMLSDEELSAQASQWRRRALQGDLHARGIAHELEREMRRRCGTPSTIYDSLDLRSLDLRTLAQRRWWRFWRGSRS